MHATKAAVEEGIVPGGGVALLRSVGSLDALLKKEHHEDIAVGIRIVRRALEEPLRQIVNNAGLEGSVVVSQVKELETDKGFDAQSESFVNMVQAGIIDPTKVARVALQNAASIAGLMLTTEALVSEVPEKTGSEATGMPGGMGDGY
jgi:chaperonin GroEL